MPDLDALLHDAARETRTAFSATPDVSVVRAVSRRRTTTRYLASGLAAAAVITGAVVFIGRDPGERQSRGSTPSTLESVETKTPYKPIGDHLAEAFAENEKLLVGASPEQQAALADGYVSGLELELAAHEKLLCLKAAGITDATYWWDDTHSGLRFTWRVADGQDPQAVGDACDRTHFEAVSVAYATQVGLLNDPAMGMEQALADCRTMDLRSWPTADALEAHCWNRTIREILRQAETSKRPRESLRSQLSVD
jgi:hypothetical protein